MINHAQNYLFRLTLDAHKMATSHVVEKKYRANFYKGIFKLFNVLQSRRNTIAQFYSRVTIRESVVCDYGCDKS
jgi:hypothetical protein